MLPRWKLTFLWLSQCCRFTSDYALRLFVVQETAQQFQQGSHAGWHTVIALFMIPSAVLTPVYGVLSNSYPKSRVLVVSGLYCWLVLLPFVVMGDGMSWFVAIFLVALGSSLYSPTRHAMLPAAARDTGWPLPRIMGVIEMGAIFSMVIGMAMGSYLQPQSWENWPNPAFVFVLVTSFLSIFLSIPTSFPSDVVRPEPMRQALVSFVSDLKLLCRVRLTCDTMLGVALLRGIVTVAVGAIIADTLIHNSGNAPSLSLLLSIAIYSTLGMGFGSILAGVITPVKHPLQWVPYAATILALVLLIGAGMAEKPPWLLFLAGLMGGLINVPILSVFQAATPADARGNAMAILNSLGCFSMAIMSGIFAGLAWCGVLPAHLQMWLVAFVACVAACLAWWRIKQFEEQEDLLNTR